MVPTVSRSPSSARNYLPRMIHGPDWFTASILIRASSGEGKVRKIPDLAKSGKRHGILAKVKENSNLGKVREFLLGTISKVNDN